MWNDKDRASLLVYIVLKTFFNLFILVHKEHAICTTGDDEMQQHETWIYLHTNWYICYTLSIMYISIYLSIYLSI